ncbi:metal-dependent transcriptional regulator [Halodesulfurarchaeum sp.]|uniref:metal-dependent transcriptional regulator n=1 Tax=Halodesulfurarchaeum sp. TaxID=1980530 RepID=UPI002FC27999
MLSDVMEDYLKVIFRLQETDEPPIPPSQIADQLDVTAPSVTSMMESLEERGLVEREKYAGVELTPEGETVALEILRHHRLLEAYLADHLDYEWSEVHEEAEVLEHHISEEFEARVAEALDHPATDPHGDPIPDQDLQPVNDDTTPLSSVVEGEDVLVCRVRDDDPAVLSHLAQIGIEPGTELELVEVTPLGVYQVTVGDTVRHLPESTADAVRVRLNDQNGTTETQTEQEA